MSPTFRRVLWWLVLLGALDCCILALPAHGTGDVLVWLNWMQNIREHGLIDGFAWSYSDYTPLSFVFLLGVLAIATVAKLGEFIVLKAGITVFAWLGVFVLWRWRSNVAVAATFLCALLLESSALGYLDAIYLAPLLLALWALEKRRIATAAFWFALATSVKWQPLLVAPFFLVAACRRPEGGPPAGPPPWQRVLLGAGPVAFGMIASFGYHPLAFSFTRALSHHALSLNALNLPWLVQWVLGAQRPAGMPLYAIPPPPAAIIAFKLLFFGGYFFLLHTFWRHGRTFADFLWAACAAVCTYFTLNTGVHENHLFMAMVMAFALLGTGERVGRTMAVHCALMLNLNLLVFYGFDGHTSLFGGGTGFVAGAVCVINGAFLVVCFLRALRLRQVSSAPAPIAPVMT